jgi:hypothetical protein
MAKPTEFVYKSRFVLISPKRTPRMHHELLSEFSTGWTCDNGMAGMSIRAGEPVDPSELLELSAGAKALFSLATLAGRRHDRISDVHKLWVDMFEVFRKALAAWTGVPTDRDPMLLFYRKQLERLCELAAFRLDLYSVSQSERLTFVRRHKDEPTEERGRSKPGGGLSAEEQKIEAFLSLPI